jgi:Raf kinase inhibitor-like YbhB/YbcL family protein
MNKLRMSKRIVGLFALILCIAIGCKKKSEDSIPSVFTLKSADITTVFGQDNFGSGFNGCTGGNKSPQLTWENAPSGTKSFAVTMVDINAFGPNVPFDHWLVINIPTSTSSLVKDAGNISGANLPIGARNTLNGAFAFDTTHPAYYNSFTGVCPNVGNTNQYEITVYALSVTNLNLAENATSTEVKAAINAAAISSAKMSVTASR